MNTEKIWSLNMKSHNSAITLQSLKVIMAIIFLLLHGCGGGGGGNSSATNQSTLMTDNPVSQGTSFSNFKSIAFTLEPASLPISGDRLFLKLNHQNGNVIYLGEIDRYRQFSINVEIKLDETQLLYELFTNNASDDTTFGVVSL